MEGAEGKPSKSASVRATCEVRPYIGRYVSDPRACPDSRCPSAGAAAGTLGSMRWPQRHLCGALCRETPLTLKALRAKDYSENPQTLGEYLKKRRRARLSPPGVYGRPDAGIDGWAPAGARRSRPLAPAELIVISGRTQIPAKDLPDGGRFFAKPYDVEALSRAFQEMPRADRS